MKLMALELRRPLRGLTTVYAAPNIASKGFDPMIVRLKLQQIRVMRWSDPNLLTSGRFCSAGGSVPAADQRASSMIMSINSSFDITLS